MGVVCRRTALKRMAPEPRGNGAVNPYKGRQTKHAQVITDLGPNCMWAYVQNVPAFAKAKRTAFAHQFCFAFVAAAIVFVGLMMAWNLLPIATCPHLRCVKLLSAQVVVRLHEIFRQTILQLLKIETGSKSDIVSHAAFEAELQASVDALQVSKGALQFCCWSSP